MIHSTAMLVSMAACLMGWATAAPSAGCGKDPLYPPGKVAQHTIHVTDPSEPNGLTRKYRMVLPTQYNKDKSLPIIFDFHGYSGNSAKQSGATGSGFRELVDTKGVVVVWPDGSDDSVSNTQGWNCLGTSHGEGQYGPTCHPDRRAWGEYECYTSCGAKCKPIGPDKLTHTCICSSCRDDVGFVRQLLDFIEDNFCIETDRVHMSGASNGAMMTYQLAHSLSPRVASIVPVVGQPLLGFLDQAVPKAPVAVLHVSGIFDGVIPANVSNGFRNTEGPEGTSWSSDGFFYHTVDQVLEKYSALNGCARDDRQWREYTTEWDGDMWWHCAEPYGACSSGASVVRCSSLGGHSWPTFLRTLCEFVDCPHLEFAHIAWDFFSNHPRKQLGSGNASFAVKK